MLCRKNAGRLKDVKTWTSEYHAPRKGGHNAEKRHACRFSGRHGMNDDFGIPRELTREVFTAQNKLRGAYRDSLRIGTRLGAFLAEAKDACRHGQFLNWLDEHFEGSPRHAQRLMLLAKTYPDPETIPALSLSEALRLLAGKEPKEETVLAQERLSGETCADMLGGFSRGIEADRESHHRPLGLEGVTAQHPAMKAAKKLAADVRRLRGLVESLCAGNM